jgi:hypothetical protein
MNVPLARLKPLELGLPVCGHLRIRAHWAITIARW